MQETNLSGMSWACKHPVFPWEKKGVFLPYLSYSIIRSSSCCESAGQCIFWLPVGLFPACLPM